MTRLPLHGVRVLDFTVVWAGPFASMLLGDLGAEVIRIESIQRPDVITRGTPWPTPAAMAQARGTYYADREAGERPWNRTAYFNFGARHKLSMTADLRRPEGLAAILRLVTVSDVVLDNNRRDTLTRLGLGYEAVRKVRPDIVYLAMPAYGTTGPYANHRGFGANTEAAVGHTWLRGYPDADPSLTYVVYQSDAAAGASAAFAIAAALHYRRRTGHGQFIDMSQAENMVHHLSQAFMDYSMNRRAQTTLGNRDVSMAPQGVYRCRGPDDWVAISVRNDADWRRLCQAIERPDLAPDPRYATAPARMRNHDDLDQILADYARDRDKYDVAEALQRAGVPAGPVVSFLDAHYDPHLTARGFFELVAEPEAGVHLHPSRGFRLSATPIHIRNPAPTLGGQNRALYQHLLGYTESELQRFIDEGLAGEVYATAQA
jgi:crotonobetainyl-CoA:carnitine CoA-transferase CaiB-like acyl-CoA transferase